MHFQNEVDQMEKRCFRFRFAKMFLKSLIDRQSTKGKRKLPHPYTCAVVVSWAVAKF